MWTTTEVKFHRLRARANHIQDILDLVWAYLLRTNKQVVKGKRRISGILTPAKSAAGDGNILRPSSCGGDICNFSAPMEYIGLFL